LAKRKKLGRTNGRAVAGFKMHSQAYEWMLWHIDETVADSEEFIKSLQEITRTMSK